MIDTARHYMPVAFIEHIIDGMASTTHHTIPPPSTRRLYCTRQHTEGL